MAPDIQDGNGARDALATWEVFQRVLELARSQLGMDIAWVSEFDAGDQVLRAVEGDTESFGVDVGFRDPAYASFCTRVIDGRLPNIVTRARADPHTRDLAITERLGIGSYVGVPVQFSTGEVYGMLCCLSHDTDRSLGNRDVEFMRLLAQVVAEQAERQEELRREKSAVTERIRGVRPGVELTTVFQPIVAIDAMTIVGAEALSRFTGGPTRPDAWFAEAASVGLGLELELKAVEAATARVDELPADAYLSVNVSPSTACSAELVELLTPRGERLVVEITEHAAVGNYDDLGSALAALRDIGVRVAVDDAGAGFASLRHILQLAPDIIKLDLAITRGVDNDPVRQALARSLAGFAGATGAALVAEGIETADELAALLRLGVRMGQGYLLGRPSPLPLRVTVDNAPVYNPTTRVGGGGERSTP